MARAQEVTPRYSTTDVCSPCGSCNGQGCTAARQPKLRSYPGIRFTADGFDCALPVTIDSHSACSYACLYCFSDNLAGHVTSVVKGLGQTPITLLEGIFSESSNSKFAQNVRKALKYNNRNVGGYPCAVQVGGINDPGDNIERQQGWFLRFGPMAVKYNQPMRVSTKGTVFSDPDYLRLFAAAPHMYWVAFSIISPDDALMRRIDVGAPSPTERLKTMAALSKLGVNTSLRLRPMFPGITDCTPKHPQAYRELIERAAAAGARAISYECGFYPSRIPRSKQPNWKRLEQLSGVPLERVYRSFGMQACTRPSYTWVEDIMHAVRDAAHSAGLTVGVSDPVWKQLGETGCCCGIRPDHAVFGNWERENATNALLEAAKDGHTIEVEEVIPPWAYGVGLNEMCHTGIGPAAVYGRNRNPSWADKLIQQWEQPRSERGPLNYFQGALMPVKLPNGKLGYKFKGLKRTYPKISPYWNVGPV